MLEARERRAEMQRMLLNGHSQPVVSLTLNIPGPVKVFHHVPEAFDEGCRRVEALLAREGISISDQLETRAKTGYEMLYSVSGNAETLKALMVTLEEQDMLGRLFDIDVLDANGRQMGRSDIGAQPRRCLLCAAPAHACARSRQHSVEELTDEIQRILRAAFLRR